MLFTAASFTISTVGTLVSVVGLIARSEEPSARLQRLGWLLLAVVLVSYVLGMLSLLTPAYELQGILPATSAVPAVLAVIVGAIGTVNCSYLAGYQRYRRSARAGMVLIPLATVAAVGNYLLY